jgi:hypothetical protein
MVRIHFKKRKQEHGSRNIQPQPHRNTNLPLNETNRWLITSPYIASISHTYSIVGGRHTLFKPIKGLPSSSGQILTSNIAHVIILVYRSLVDHPRPSKITLSIQVLCHLLALTTKSLQSIQVYYNVLPKDQR